MHGRACKRRNYISYSLPISLRDERVRDIESVRENM